MESLSADLDARTAARITPRLQAFSDVTQRLATARARQQQLELVLRQWDRADDIGAAAEKLRADRETMLSMAFTAGEVFAERQADGTGYGRQTFKARAADERDARPVAICRVRAGRQDGCRFVRQGVA